MPLISRKGILAVAVVIDVANHASGRLVTAKSLARRYSLPARHFEPVLQGLVRDGILRGIRGPHGGYELCREEGRISVEQILRAVGAVEDVSAAASADQSELISSVVIPVLQRAERAFAQALARISIADLTNSGASRATAAATIERLQTPRQVSAPDAA